MYKELVVGNKTYRIEFSIEASLYSDCTERVFSFMNALDNSGAETLEEKENKVKEMIKQTSELPMLALHMLYAGLMEHHGEDGDRSIMSLRDAKKVLKMYLIEHKDKGDGDYASLIALLIDQMGEDGFFNLIGIDKIMNQSEA